MTVALLLQLACFVAALACGYQTLRMWLDTRRRRVLAPAAAGPRTLDADGRQFELFSECPACATPGLHLLSEPHEDVFDECGGEYGNSGLWWAEVTYETRMARACTACGHEWQESMSQRQVMIKPPEEELRRAIRLERRRNPYRIC